MGLDKTAIHLPFRLRFSFAERVWMYIFFRYLPIKYYCDINILVFKKSVHITLWIFFKKKTIHPVAYHFQFKVDICQFKMYLRVFPELIGV